MNFSGGGGRGSVGGGRENDFLQMMMMPLPLHHNPLPAAAEIGDGGDGEFPKRDERVLQWSHRETRDLIAIRAELERDFTVAKRNKTLWEVVSARMRELGYRRTADQCKCKWKTLVNRYKGKETTDLVDGRQFPFFEELHAIFTEREKNMQRMLLESEAGSTQAKKKVKRISGDQSSEELSYYEDEDEVESDGQRTTSSSNPRKRKDEREKVEKEKRLRIPRQPSTGNMNNSGNSIGSLQEMLQEFLQQQQRIEMMWKESIERHAYERQMFEREWRLSMEKLERERLMAEQAWGEREEQRRIREESRAEKRDALLTTLLNRLINENHP
ncbi:hypothetical protein Acr_24g0017330 [Actinidia rufa]|uniref:Myb-like domain-containing protein n=1 Tax=Actinidia rufa TaxID=165716 RepID=A0A7J0GXK8_9ERIC|nr:hypothetical protein Acr_24g0017330 [Actinidia rufa]